MSKSYLFYHLASAAFWLVQGYLCFKEPAVWGIGAILFILTRYICLPENDKGGE